MVLELFDLTGRVALVSGAGQNMGRAAALAFAEAGADLLICDYRAETLERTAGEITALGRRVVPVVCDVSDIGQIRGMYERLDREFGRIDILANIPGNNHLFHPEDLPIEKFWRDQRSMMITEGPEEILKSALARRVFELYA